MDVTGDRLTAFIRAMPLMGHWQHSRNLVHASIFQRHSGLESWPFVCHQTICKIGGVICR